MRIDDVARLKLGTFVRPAEETGTGSPRVETVLGYVARTPAGLLLLDTGLGDSGQRRRLGTGQSGSGSRRPSAHWVSRPTTSTSS